MDVFFLIGNGLSIGVRPHLALPQLRQAFLAALEQADRQLLERLGEQADDLESSLANVEVLRDALHAIRSLSPALASEELHAVARAITDTHLDERLDRLYFAYCFAVLHRLGQAWNPDEVEEALGDWLEHVGAWLDAAERSHIFSLNFDLLVEVCLLNQSLLDRRHDMTDFFVPVDERPDAWWPEGILAYEFMPGQPSDRKIRLYHPHGALSYLSNRRMSRAFKMRAEDVRDAGMYEQLRAQPLPATWTPAIILGGGKERKATEFPFTFAFDQMRQCLTNPKTSVGFIVGYGFRDPHVNALLGEAHDDVRWVVVDRRVPADRAEFEARVRDVLGVDDVEFYFEGANDPELPSPDD
jgi:hypothetical protein